MFFNAVAVMQRVPSGVGQIVYGSNYYSKDYLTRLHLYYGKKSWRLPCHMLVQWMFVLRKFTVVCRRVSVVHRR